MIADIAGNEKHIGAEVRFAEHVNKLACVEEYFREQCLIRGVDVSYDCTAGEPLHFKTLNYTTFAGLFICNPLQFQLSFQQIQDASVDNLESIGHLGFVKTKHKGGKYSGASIEFTEGREYNMAVLPGGNKFDTLDWDKLKELSKEDLPLVVKPHPVSTPADLDEIQRRLPRVVMAPRLSKLYPIISGASKVYTTHVSETALTASLLGKSTHFMDKYPHCMTGSFSHITYQLFSKRMTLESLDKAFASPKSGIIHPEVDLLWQDKVDSYLDYIMQQRENQRGYSCGQTNTNVISSR